MAAFNFKRFSHPDTFREIEPSLLLQFLLPFEEFFSGRGVTLPADSNDGLDYEALVSVVMTPDADTPPDLGNALYVIHEMATEEGMDQLLAEAQVFGIPLSGNPDPTPAEVALQVWLHNREVLERKHAETFLTRPRSFEYFQTNNEDRDLDEPSRDVLAALEHDLDDWFETKRRGRGCRVFAYLKGGEVWFLVRHGDPFKREGSLKEGKPSSVFYRPAKTDVVVYNPASGELRINARSRGEKDHYRSRFGLYLFSDDQFFPGKAKYTLEPLRQDGQAALVCSDIEGLEWVVLKEIQYFWGGPAHEVEIRRADDVFAALEARGASIPDGVHLRSAKFEVKFIDSMRPRAVTVRPSNIAQYTRDPDSVHIDQWLTQRGFVRAAPASDATT
jgi:hypothetical protein